MAPTDPTFNKVMNDWINDSWPECKKKIGKFKPRAAGQPDPKDDTDLARWKEDRWTAFQAKFMSELEEIQTSKDLTAKELKEVGYLLPTHLDYI